MKFRLSILVFFLMCIRIVHAQDLIVKDNGDSLNCKIIYIESDFIHFSFKHENEVRVTMLPVKQVKFYKKHFYPTSEVSNDTTINNLDSTSKDSQGKIINRDYKKMRLGIYGGLSYEVAKVSSNVPEALQEYVKELQSGYHFGVDFTYFISENIGFGIKYSNFFSKNEIDRVYVTDTSTGQIFSGHLKDDIEIQFIAPAFATRIISQNKKTNFVAGVALGYLSYKDKATIINDFTLTGGTVGLLIDAGVEFACTKNLYFGFAISYLMGSLTEYEYDDGVQKRTIKFEDGTAEGLNRFDLSVGFHWSF